MPIPKYSDLARYQSEAHQGMKKRVASPLSRSHCICCKAVASLRLLIVFTLVLTGCLDKNSLIKEKVTMAIESARLDKRVDQLDVQAQIDKKISRICIQTPYITKVKFEERTKQKVNNFSEVDDGFYIIWFFLSDGTNFQVKIDRWKQMGLSEKSLTCSPSPKLLFERNRSQTNFFILGK